MKTEVLFAVGYAVSLTASAFSLEWLSAHTHRRALRFRTAGFTYDEARDFWLCPQGEQLWPHKLDHEQRLMRYRARPGVCNACPAKHRCTDSDRGREIVRPLDPWPHSEAGRFHRVIALTLVVLATVILLAELARNHTVAETAVLVSSLLPVAFGLRWLVRDLRTHPDNFPDPKTSPFTTSPAGRSATSSASRPPGPTGSPPGSATPPSPSPSPATWASSGATSRLRTGWPRRSRSAPSGCSRS